MEVLTIVLKGLLGGLLVVLFSLIGEVVRPRSLAGITSAAPAVAVGSLLITLVAKGSASAAELSLGMIAGAGALVLFCLVGADGVKRLGALKGSVVTTVVWFVTAFSLWAVFLR